MAKQKYSYNEAPQDTTKNIKRVPRESVPKEKIYVAKEKHLTPDEKEKKQAMRPFTNEEKLRMYGLDGKQSGAPRKDAAKFSIKPTPLDSVKYEKELKARQAKKE